VVVNYFLKEAEAGAGMTESKNKVYK